MPGQSKIVSIGVEFTWIKCTKNAFNQVSFKLWIYDYEITVSPLKKWILDYKYIVFFRNQNHITFFYRSEHTCDVAVSGDGKLESSVCQEVHLFRPLSTSSSGATTIVKQHVKLVDEKKSASNVNILFLFLREIKLNFFC